jgi:hypothetical protein
MDIVNLPPGRRASIESDCISIQQAGAGRFVLNGSILARRQGSDGAESVALIGGDPYPSFADAEAAGLAWASEHGVETLYVSRSEGSQPLPELP